MEKKPSKQKVFVDVDEACGRMKKEKQSGIQLEATSTSTPMAHPHQQIVHTIPLRHRAPYLAALNNLPPTPPTPHPSARAPPSFVQPQG
jgi:hypothetical protein